MVTDKKVTFSMIRTVVVKLMCWFPIVVEMVSFSFHHCVRMEEQLGEGNFSTVHLGTWMSPDGPKQVAIKRLRSDAYEDVMVNFLQEAAIMGQFHHNNVVKLVGIHKDPKYGPVSAACVYLQACSTYAVCTVLHCTILVYCILLYRTVLYYIYCLYCIVLYVLYHTVLYYTVLYCTVF